MYDLHLLDSFSGMHGKFAGKHLIRIQSWYIFEETKKHSYHEYFFTKIYELFLIEICTEMYGKKAL